MNKKEKNKLLIKELEKEIKTYILERRYNFDGDVYKIKKDINIEIPSKMAKKWMKLTGCSAAFFCNYFSIGPY